MAGSIVGSNVIAVMVYVYPLSAKPELGADNFAIEQRISLTKARSVAVSTGAT